MHLKGSLTHPRGGVHLYEVVHDVEATPDPSAKKAEEQMLLAALAHH